MTYYPPLVPIEAAARYPALFRVEPQVGIEPISVVVVHLTPAAEVRATSLSCAPASRLNIGPRACGYNMRARVLAHRGVHISQYRSPSCYRAPGFRRDINAVATDGSTSLRPRR